MRLPRLTRPRVARAWALAAIGAVAWLGCNQLLGNRDDDQLAPSTGGAGGTPTGPDGGPDAPPDAPADAPVDAPPDALADAPADAPSDAPVDAPPLCAMIPAVGGACTSPRSLCGTGCYNLTCDPENCGACAHDCAGGTCAAGACRPIALITSENGPEGIAVDDAGIYWADHGSGNVRIMALDGGGVSTVASGQAGPVGILVTPTHIYWSNNGGGTVQLSPKASFSTSFFATGDRPLFLATDGTTLYWANQGVSGAGSSLEGASLADGGIERVSDAGGAGPIDVALNASAVYWTSATGIYTAPLSGGNGGLAAKDLNGPLALAVTSTTLFWTNSVGEVFSQPVAGGTPTVIHSGESHATGMAVDGTDVYWVDQGTGNVFRAPLGATNESTTVTIATGQNGPYRIAVDAKFVYWTNYSSGSVARLAK